MYLPIMKKKISFSNYPHWETGEFQNAKCLIISIVVSDGGLLGIRVVLLDRKHLLF